MVKQTILGVIALISTALLPVSGAVEPLVSPLPETKILAEHQLDLTNREPNPYANEIFADNILLALHYLKGDTNILVYSYGVDWEKVRESFEVSFVLELGATFAFHGNTLPEFDPPAGGPAVTMNSKFYIEEGYKSVGGLGGNGVCHLASLMNWTASEAGLEVVAKANHNFGPVPGVPKEYGTSIRSQSPNQNLYIKNGFDFPVTFIFSADNGEVGLKIRK